MKLYEQEIENKQSGEKFEFDEAVLWKFEVTVDDGPYKSFVVEAK
ncbi:hypothetical protein [Salipaludibacillus neizhouensis]|nr:hypothetical protein [Salipaludibacillus neizhouensis]